MNVPEASLNGLSIFSLDRCIHKGDYHVLARNIQWGKMNGTYLELPFRFNAWVEQDDSNSAAYSIEKERGEYLISFGTWRAIVTPSWWHKDIKTEKPRHITVHRRYPPVIMLMFLVSMMAGSGKEYSSTVPLTLSTNRFVSVVAQKEGKAWKHGGDKFLYSSLVTIERAKERGYFAESCNANPNACFWRQMELVLLNLTFNAYNTRMALRKAEEKILYY